MKAWIAVALVAPWALAGTATRAEEPATAKKPSARAEAKPAMDPAAMQALWEKLATPGAAHKWLGRVEGTWDCKVTFWMEPGKPQETTGVSENKMTMDGRWLEQRFEGTMMGQPFRGLGYTGYDNYKKKYIGTWTDTSTTSMMISEGTVDASGRVMISNAMIDDPSTGKPAKVKMVWTLKDDDHHLFEMWMTGADGKMSKSMEILYTRKK